MKETNFIKVIFLLTSVLMFSCKKDTKTEPSAIGPLAYINNPIVNGLPSNMNSINGVLIAYKEALTNTSVKYDSQASFSITSNSFKYFYPYQPTNSSFFKLNGGDNVGLLKANNIASYFEGANITQDWHTYVDTNTTRQYSSSINWNLNSSGAFPSFNTTVPRGFPAVISSSFMPTSISKTSSLTLNFGGSNFSNVDSIEVKIVANLCATKVLPANATSVSFSANDLFFIASTNASTAYVVINLKNYSYSIVNNKTLIFMMVSSLYSSANVTP